MDLEKDGIQIIRQIPEWVKTHFFEREKREKSINLISRSLARELSPIAEQVWEDLLNKQSEILEEAKSLIRQNQPKEKIHEQIAQTGDPERTRMLDFIWEDAVQQIEEERFYIFPEIGERVTDKETIEKLQSSLIQEEMIHMSASGSWKSQFLFLTTHRVFIFKKGLSAFLSHHGSFHLNFDAIPYESVTKITKDSNWLAGTLEIEHTSQKSTFQFRKDLTDQMDEVVAKIHELQPPPKPLPGKNRGGSDHEENNQNSVEEKGTITEEMPKCQSCGAIVQADDQFCSECGSSLKRGENGAPEQSVDPFI